MNILVTGAFGFLGSAITKQFSNYKDFNVYALVKSTSSKHRFSNFEIDKITTIFIDKVDLESIFKNIQFQVVIHTATDYGRETTIDKVVKNNVVFPLKIIELAQKNQTELFINTDSYFNKSFNNYSYLQSYVLTKRHLEDYLKTIFSIPIVNIKLEHIYGYQDSNTKFVTNIFNKLVGQEPIIEASEGFQKRDFIFIEDIVNLYFEVVVKKAYFDKAYYLIEAGTGKSIEIKHFMMTMKKIIQSNSEIQFGALPMRKNEILDSFANLSLLPNFIQWKPTISIEEGIKKMVDFYNNK